jgi:hypothetical protein
MHWFALALFFIGCTAPEHYPPGGGGLPPPGGDVQRGPDAGAYDAYERGDASASQLVGRVCRITDLRYPTRCAQNPDMSGIEVRVQGSESYAVTAQNSRFVLDLGAPQAAVTLNVAFGGGEYVSSVLPLQLDYGTIQNLFVPIVDADAWQTLLTDLDVQVPDGTGAIATYLTYRDSPEPGVQVSNVSATAGIYYDYGVVPYWVEGGATGAAGATLIFGVNEPVAELTASSLDNLVNVVADIPVTGGAITFISAELGSF